MRPHERREAGAETFFKLATFNPRLMVYQAGKTTYPTEAAARKAARAKGRYQVERFDGREGVLVESFEVP